MKQIIRKNFNIPNTLTAIRILLVAPFVYFFVTHRVRLAIVLMLLSGLTDVLDGMIARKFNQSTQLGQLLDPLADKLVQIAIAICLAFTIPILLPLLALFVFKELLMLVGAYVMLRKHKRPSPAKWFGKVATVLFYVSVTAIIVLHLLYNPRSTAVVVISYILLAVTGCFMLIALVGYFKIFVDTMKAPTVLLPESTDVPKES